MDLPKLNYKLNINYDNIAKQCKKFSSTLLTTVKYFSTDNCLDWNINYISPTAFAIHLNQKNYIVVDVHPEDNGFCDIENFKVTTFVESLTDNTYICDLLQYHTRQIWTSLGSLFLELVRVMYIISYKFDKGYVRFDKLKTLKYNIIQNLFDSNCHYDDKANLVTKKFITNESSPLYFDVKL